MWSVLNMLRFKPDDFIVRKKMLYHINPCVVIFLQMIHHLCYDPASLECSGLLKEYLVGMSQQKDNFMQIKIQNNYSSYYKQKLKGNF